MIENERAFRENHDRIAAQLYIRLQLRLQRGREGRGLPRIDLELLESGEIDREGSLLFFGGAAWT